MCTYREVGDYFGISESQVSRRLSRSPLKEAWAAGQAEGHISLRRSIQKAALAGGATAMTLAARHVLGWDDKHVIDAHLTTEKPVKWVARFGGMDDDEDD